MLDKFTVANAADDGSCWIIADLMQSRDYTERPTDPTQDPNQLVELSQAGSVAMMITAEVNDDRVFSMNSGGSRNLE